MTDRGKAWLGVITLLALAATTPALAHEEAKTKIDPSMILSGGAPGKRFALPNSRVMLHQPHGGIEGQSADIEIHAAEIARQRLRVEEILAEHTGQTVDRIHADTERDFILGPEEARDYGVVDEVVASRELVGVPRPIELRPQGAQEPAETTSV